ncbi:MAG: FliA/WhiG family RNA polymerase sigma factor [Bacillota bacterium]|nr:FliA/WhiG family RNA polymerase sigma factor [Bacillota bacterium]
MRREYKSIDELWQRYKFEDCAKAQEEIITHYLPFVNQIVNRLRISLPSNITKEELISFGIYGLFDAMVKFDLSRGYKFETYAFPRIRGAILDGLRSMDYLPASLRQKEKKLVSEIGQLEQTLCRTATDQEIADKLGISCEELSGLLDMLNFTTIISLDQMMTNDGEETASIMESVSDDASKQPESIFDKVEVQNLLIESINKLPEKEKLVVALHYYEGMNLKEISKIMDLSESRISQLHTKAIFRLRGRLSRQKKILL